MTGTTQKTTTQPRRRAILAGAGAALAAGALAALPKAASAAPGSDAELIAACDRFTALEHEKRHIYATSPNTVEGDRIANAATAPIYEEQDAILDRVYQMEAVTWDGMRARLRMAFAYQPKCIEMPSDWDDYIAGAIVDDLNRLLGASTGRISA